MKNGISRLSGELGTSLNLMNRKEKMILFRKWNIKTKIFYKLIFYFVISLLLFSIVVGGVFSSMFIKNTVNLTKKNLEIRALKISSILSSEPANRIEKMKEITVARC